jgi:hypothetical protein
MNPEKIKHKKKSKFFLSLGLIGLLAVLIGFSKTFILPTGRGTFKAPTIIYVHGGFAICWIILFVVQSILIRKSNFRLHKRLGYAGMVVGVGVAITIIPAGLYQVQKDLASGMGQMAISLLVGSTTSSIIFLSLVIAGLKFRYNPAAHKRLMALATIVVLWPAWFRFRHFFPAVPNPEIWFAIVIPDAFFIVAIIWDKINNKKIHWAFLYIGPLIIIENCLEYLLLDSKPWRSVAYVLYNFLN